MRRIGIVIAAILVVTGINVLAQDKGGSGEPKPHPTAADLMKKFDTNKDGKLDQTELTALITDLRKNNPHANAEGGGSSTNAPSGHQPPAPDKMAAKWIKDFASDKTALTEAELQTALESHHHRGDSKGHQGDSSGSDNQGK